MSYNMLGIETQIDHINDEEIINIGLDNQMPIALFLALSCKAKDPLVRYMSLITYDKNAYILAEQFNNENHLDRWVNTISDKFDYEEPYIPPKDENGHTTIKPMSQEAYKAYRDLQYNPAEDTVLPLYVYARQFFKFFSMKTANFNNYETGIVLECPKSHANFWSRTQFQEVYKSIDTALEHTLQEVVRVMILKGIEVDQATMTIKVEGFKPLTLKHSFMF